MFQSKLRSKLHVPRPRTDWVIKACELFYALWCKSVYTGTHLGAINFNTKTEYPPVELFNTCNIYFLFFM